MCRLDCDFKKVFSSVDCCVDEHRVQLLLVYAFARETNNL